MSERMVVTSISELLTMVGGPGGGAEETLGLQTDGALVVEDGRVVWVGPEADLPESYLVDAEIVDAGGRVVMPGLVECHTHLLFGGNRAHEFELRSQGLSYEEIGRRGDGIAHTVAATRASGADQLFATGMERLDDFLATGITTVEIKSGYGLDTDTELKLLETARSLQGRHPVNVVSTFLGAHIVAPEYREKREQYVDLVCNEMIPEIARAGLARFCDVFCEEGAFSVAESRRILECGKSHGLVPKIHAEQLTRSGASMLAAEIGAASADHLDFAEAEDARALAERGVIPVLLPGATFFIGKKRYPDGRLFIEAGAEIAISTDYNPGSSHTRNLWLMGTMACCYCGLTPSQALRAMTAGAARALLMQDEVGSLAAGMKADFLILKDSDWQEVLYLYGRVPVHAVYKAGERVVR